ncbi:uncharacterized protein TNIN_364741 [Trichonephila inaurata madagascariensis]|uniref:Uncharacterized protein n=1 Tax=Trichonephila inaurata madagascariensis TaxID=2747483 RepID=A0A8X6YET7_9ARAC|nr:uncharacterized protein TNIN_364741 [Trichonephila inaurata madagascariensis]
MLRYVRTGLSVGPKTVYSWRRPFPMTTNRLSPFQIGPADPQSVVPPTEPAPIGRRPRDVTRHVTPNLRPMGEWRKPRDQQQQEFLSPHLFLPLIPPFHSFYLLLCVHVNCAQWRADHGADNDARNARTTRQEARPQIKYIKKKKRKRMKVR